MSTTTTQSILIQLRAAIDARRDSLIALRGRLMELTGPIPVGTRLCDDAGEVCRVVDLESLSDHEKGWGLLTPAGKIEGQPCGGRLLADDMSAERMCLAGDMYPDPEAPLLREPGARTRELAARLPAAIARYMAHCEQERAKNDAAAAAVAAAL